MKLKMGNTLFEALYTIAKANVEMLDYVPVETDSEDIIGDKNTYVAKLNTIYALMEQAHDLLEELISELPDEGRES